MEPFIRRTAAAIAGLALVASSGSAASATPAAPAVVPPDYGTAAVSITLEGSLSIDQLEPFAMPGATPIIGDFVGPTNSDEDQLDDILWYTPGPGGDALWRTVGDRTWESTAISIDATATPIVGRFTDGDTKDDIFWYAPGTAGDSRWDFNDDGTITTTAFTVNGTFKPILGSFTDDGAQDILWYAPGTAADSWWDFNEGGTVTKRAFNVSGTYTPVVGSFSGSTASDHVQDVLWYAPGTKADAVWDINADATITKRPLTINGTYTPIAGTFAGDAYTDVLWYAPGTAPDSMWDFDNASLAKTIRPFTINGSYTPLTHPWGALFAGLDSATDILWFGAGTKPDAIWDFGSTAGAYTSRPISLVGDRRPVLARLEVVQWTSTAGTSYSTGSDVIDLTSPT